MEAVVWDAVEFCWVSPRGAYYIYPQSASSTAFSLGHRVFCTNMNKGLSSCFHSTQCAHLSNYNRILQPDQCFLCSSLAAHWFIRVSVLNSIPQSAGYGYANSYRTFIDLSCVDVGMWFHMEHGTSCTQRTWKKMWVRWF